ncbi:hypothetical protein ERICIV_00303 [Paenibacillus larvae subsp. larvae]|uniref:Uncharacterized protein n=2 Tax=Paenibacillus larvae TaxID=1464 RepID=A0A1V0UTM5_9BACL|nr:M50 family metallopeptidase [Paenibacillus larvae]AQT85246.1 hypothetical protein B1222_13935 [Paenibacillus larvae subsp. pulvifaciens]AQZ47254.1 hypothetical protein B5S25_12320 [Paenibacillus larvae subsp. pulvifaciens]ARF68605.1 hypothetical protein B7C51_13530 [Paenibacillus larvae subsp. pulvifaciens]AVF24549.1 hypothetical protein ERICIII_00303 [Paenibacillus larvae subsp. larvae]AVF29310.1 hypothetical protein ERICIV_00303 [Paenibacillus larvae subsp. larvae]
MGKRPWMTTILLLIACALLTRLVPFSSFFRNVDTMIHETGHAVVTLLLSGKVNYIELFQNHGGVTYSVVVGSWKMIPIALAGYVTASLFAVFMFYAQSQGKQRLGLQVITVVALLDLLLFVRNGFGIAWLFGLIALNVAALFFVPKWLQNGYFILLAFLCLEESVVGPITLVRFVFSGGGAAGDAANLAKFTSIPGLVWALFFLGFAFWCAMKCIKLFLGNRSSKQKQLPPYSRNLS